MSDASALNRYPFTIPVGWFAVAETPDLTVGQTRAAYYFDTHLVLWRGETGEAHVMDAFWSLDTIFEQMPDVAFRDEVWPKFLRENAMRVFQLD